MKVKVFCKYYILIWGSFLLVMGSCAPERNGIVANVYHNTTARYNAYFYAKMRMDEIQAAISESQENNFNKILQVFPETDTSLISSLDKQIEDCIKKASAAIERHPNSRWTDDSYILIGQCRLYHQNFSDAIKTFKYVNTQSENDEARHRALIKLMRTFIEAQEQNNAIAVSDYLKKEKLNRENKAQLYLTRAYLYQLNGDYSNVVGNLLVAAPLLQNDEGRARIYYIVAQVYQELGFDAQAYQNYQQVLKSNPEYELYFYARLNMAQVYDLTREKDTKKIRKYFKKLLKDKKNLEYKDKIYYEMASFEQKQDNLDEAVGLYNQSVRASLNNNRQKAYAYLALGRIYYDDYHQYELAKAYYDSTISVLPQDELEYEQIAQRQEVLANFVEQLNTIQEQDSLLALAEMDSTELSAFLDDILLQQENARQEEEKVQKKKAKRKTNNSSFPEVSNPFDMQNQETDTEENWYFYSTAAISMGRTAFVRKWGNRPLEDNWRRADKNISANFASEEADSIAVAEVVAEEGQTPEEIAEIQRQVLYADIPFSEEQQQEALAMIEEAYYKLGGIYDFDLKEKQNAIETFETLLTRFPASEYKPEVLYQLYLIYKELNDDTYIKYKNQLLEEFPGSLYAKIIENPNYRQESNLASEKMKQAYKEAYALYEKEEYAKAEQLVSASLMENPDNSFADNMTLLRVLITGKMENASRYQLALQNFLSEYPESELQEYATKLLENARNFDTKVAASKGAQYIAEFDEKHSFIILYKNVKNLSTTLPKVIEAFNKKYFANQKLTTANLMLEDGQVMIIVEQFPDMETAQVYYKKFNSEVSPVGNLPSVAAQENITGDFIITEDNLNILYKTKDIENYLRFFQKNYM